MTRVQVLDVGDFVRVTGTVEPTWTSAEEELDDQAGLIVGITHDDWADFLVYVFDEQEVYECFESQVTRITKAEALA